MAGAEIPNLFAALASHLETLNLTIPPRRREEEEERSLDLAISELNQSLHLDDDDDSTVKFLDTVLSAMGFKAPQVFALVTEQLVETIATASSSSIACRVLRFQSAEALEIGCSISRRDCAEMLKASREVLTKFEANHVPERLSNQLLDAVVRSAASSSWYKNMFPLSPILDAKSLEWRCPAALMLLSHLPLKVSLDDHAAPLRLLLWYLDPLILNHDISKILQETMKRPFLSPVKELRERMEWKMIILCLVLSPAMFCETRALLHNWFLKTGLECILEFMVDLVSVILDIISGPTWWGMSTESGLKLPFSHAYFPFKHHLFRTLAGPISFTSLLSLVHSISEEVSTKHEGSIMEMANHRSFWAIAITFPSWYYYAAVLLFSDKTSEGTIPIESPSKIEEQSRDVASKYIAWILCPFSQTIQETLVNCLRNMSVSWTTRNFASDGQSKDSAGFRKKLKKPKFHEAEDICRTIAIWLDKFEKIHSTCWNQIGSLQRDSFFRRIPLGILIGVSNELCDSVYELLLHYALTGRTSVKYDEYDEDEAVRGACLVFRLTDIVKNMSESLFEDEEIGSNFVLRFKERSSRFLFKCIRRLLQLEDSLVIVSDLHRRFLQWKHQVREYINPRKDFSDIVVELESRIL